jgi:hypothetical protein
VGEGKEEVARRFLVQGEEGTRLGRGAARLGRGAAPRHDGGARPRREHTRGRRTAGGRAPPAREREGREMARLAALVGLGWAEFGLT